MRLQKVLLIASALGAAWFIYKRMRAAQTPATVSGLGRGHGLPPPPTRILLGRGVMSPYANRGQG